MDLIEQPDQQETATRKKPKILWICLDSLAGLFWLYAIIKLFVFDVDVYFVSLVNPQLLWLLHYKSLILLGLIFVAMLLMRSFSLGFAVAYIVFYPLVILFWKLPKFIWKQQSWLFVFAILNSTIGFIRSFKRNFISGTLFVFSATLILSFGNEYILGVSSLVIFSLLVFAYALAFIRGFKPSAVFQTYTKVFPVLRKGNFLTVDASVRSLPLDAMTEKQLEIRTNSLQNIVIYNRSCLLISKKLRDYRPTRQRRARSKRAGQPQPTRPLPHAAFAAFSAGAACSIARM